MQRPVESAAQSANAKRGPWFAAGSGASGIRAIAPSGVSDKGIISSHSALRVSRTGMHGKPGASVARHRDQRLRLGDAPPHSPGNPTSNHISVCCNYRHGLDHSLDHSHGHGHSCGCGCGSNHNRGGGDEPRSGGETRVPKRSGWFYEVLFGARSAAGSMTPLSLTLEGARTQIPDAPLPSAGYGVHLA